MHVHTQEITGLQALLAEETAARVAAEARFTQAAAQATRLEEDLAQLEVDQRTEVLTLRQARSKPYCTNSPPPLSTSAPRVSVCAATEAGVTQPNTCAQLSTGLLWTRVQRTPLLAQQQTQLSFCEARINGAAPHVFSKRGHHNKCKPQTQAVS